MPEALIFRNTAVHSTGQSRTLLLKNTTGAELQAFVSLPSTPCFRMQQQPSQQSGGVLMEDPACLAVKVPPDTAFKASPQGSTAGGPPGVALPASIMSRDLMNGVAPSSQSLLETMHPSAMWQSSTSSACLLHALSVISQMVLELDLMAQGAASTGGGAAAKNWHGEHCPPCHLFPCQ